MHIHTHTCTCLYVICKALPVKFHLFLTQTHKTECSKCHFACFCEGCSEVFATKHTPSACEKYVVNLAAFTMSAKNGTPLAMCSNSRVPAHQPNKANSAETAANTDEPASEHRNSSSDTFPGSWAGYLAAKRGDQHFDLPEQFLRMPPVLAMLTDSLSVPLTIVYALHKHYGHALLANMPHISVHIIGATESFEDFGTHKYEEIMHWLPACRSLSLSLVGPELAIEASTKNEEIQLCEGCVSAGCIPIQVNRALDLYHEWEGRHKKPTLALACNSGLHQDIAQAKEWAEGADGEPAEPQVRTPRWIMRPQFVLLFCFLVHASP